MTRRETIVEMLRRYEEAQAVLVRSGDGSGGAPLLMPRTWNGSFRQLERLLVRLREERPRQYAHLHARYLDPDYRKMTVPVERKPQGPKLKLPPHCELAAGQPVSKEKSAEVRVLVWPAWVRQHVVDLAVEWLDEQWVGCPFLPAEFVAA